MQLYLVTDEQACLGRDLYWVVEEAVKGGVSIVQLREKNLPTHAFIDRALRMKELLTPYGVPLIINDRVDVALASDANGVHVGQTDMPYEEVRQVLPRGKLIGLSAERKEDVLRAEEWDINYLAVSPLFSTPTKTDTHIPWGMEGLQWVRTHSRHPLVVIGGLNSRNVPEARAHGADSIAVISAICSAPSPRQAAQALLAAFNSLPD
jgi:thiamine-phosphate pyrophosphorylase